MSLTTNNLTNKISDLKKFSEEKKQEKQLEKPQEKLQQTHAPEKHVTIKQPRSPSRATSSSNNERPASRAEIYSLEKELEDKVRLVLDSASFLRRTNEDFGAEFSYQPHKETVINTRDKMLGDLGATPLDIEEEPWLDSYLKCECLKTVSDEISSKFSDIIGVSSTEMGNVSRKLRLTYKQSFEQLAESWKSLRMMVKRSEQEIKTLASNVADLEEDIKTKEEEVAKRFDDDIARMHREFALERERDQEKIAQAQFKMDQMSDTLKYLNGIFRTMQNDGSTLKTTDLQTVVSRLEKENRELKTLNHDTDSIKVQLATATQRVRQLEGQILIYEDEKSKMLSQLARRDEAIAGLMEREAIRAAEIEKLQKMAKMKDDELLSLDMKDPATSVLCIKCKRSLDDLTNIKAALLGDQAMGKIQRVQCETFRILLPNLKNRKPSRSNAWLRNTMRCILITKMREHLAWQALKPEVVRFPAFVYSWFSRSISGLSGSMLTKALVLCDEDRWALYYGCKSLGKDDPEAALFWSLLDESYGQDGLHFLLHCLGVILTLGGMPLWHQLGRVLMQGVSIEDKPDESEIRQTIWVDLPAAKEAVSLILTRALSVHVSAALEAIEALKVSPTDLDKRATAQDSDTANNTNANSNPTRRASMKDATHVNMFTLLRVLQQQLHADKIHRSAAIRLMFETASVGALTPALPSYDNGAGNNSGTNNGHNLQGVTNTHVEYPQFQSICLTLFPRISIAEIAGLYAVCHQHGQRRVSAEIFTFEADLRGLFVRSMVLPNIPLLRHLIGTDIFVETDDINATIEEEPENGSKPMTVSFTSPVILNKVYEHNAPYKRAVKFDTRSQLATLVHRKLASIKPLIIEHLLPRLPNVWAAMLNDALFQVTSSLEETFAQLKLMRKQDEEGTSTGGPGGLSRLVSGASSPMKGKSFAAPAANANNANKSTNALVSAMNKAAATVNNNSDAEDPILQAAAIADTYLDGIQPYMHYRKLLSLLAVAMAMNDNPLVPVELFSGQQLASNTDRVMRRAEKMLSHLEEAIVLPVKSAVEAKDFHALHQPKVERLLEKYVKFEEIRRTLVARKLQAVTRQFLYREVAVPRAIRMLMAAGYLSDHRNRTLLSAMDIKRSISQVTSANTGANSSSAQVTSAVVAAVFAGSGGKTQGLRWREVSLDIWVGNSTIASIYLFKLDYDLKAARLGLAPVSLPQAVSAYFYHILGTASAAERAIHDLFVCIRNYRHTASRLRLFSLFVGDARESGLVPSMAAGANVTGAGGALQTHHLSATAAAVAIAAEESGQQLVTVLASPQAWSVYMQLLMRIHAAVSESSRAFRVSTTADDNNNTAAAAAAVDANNSSGNEAAENSVISLVLTKEEQKNTEKGRLVVDTLFPSSENPFHRADKKDVWLLDVELLVNVAQQFTKRQQRHWFPPGHSSNSNHVHSVYTDLPEKLKADAQNRIDVDDFLYLMVLQWAKLQVWQLQRVTQRGQQMNNIQPTAAASAAAASANTPKNAAKNTSSANTANNNSDNNSHRGMVSRRLSQLPLSALQAIADSVYQQRAGDAVVSTSSILSTKVYTASNSINNTSSSNGNANNHELSAAAAAGGDEKREEESLLLSDPLHYAAAYIRCVRSRRFALSLPPANANASATTSPTHNDHANNSNNHGHGGNAEEIAQEILLYQKMQRIESRLLVELNDLIRETVLWDTNLGLFLRTERILWRHNHAHVLAHLKNNANGNNNSSSSSNGGGKTAKRAILDATAVTTIGSNNTRSSISANRPKSSSANNNNNNNNKNNKDGHHHSSEGEEDDVFALDVLVTEACAPEYLFASVKQMFHAYHNVLHTFLAGALASANAHANAAAAATESSSSSAAAASNNNNNSSSTNNLKNAKNAAASSSTINVNNSSHIADEAMVQNVRQRVQSLRAQLLALSDFFSQPEQSMASDRLYVLQRLGASVEDVAELEGMRQQHRAMAREAQFLFRNLISNVAELAVVAQMEFPRDSWHAGAKIHVDRAFAFSIHLRPSL